MDNSLTKVRDDKGDYSVNNFFVAMRNSDDINKARAKLIIKAWDNMVNVMKSSLENKAFFNEDKDLVGLWPQEKVSKKIFGGKGYIKGLRTRNIAYNRRNYVKPIPKTRLHEFYYDLRRSKEVFDRDWLNVENSFKNLYAVRFKGQQFSGESLKQITSVRDFKIWVEKSLEGKIVDFLKIPATVLSRSSLGKLFHNYASSKKGTLEYFVGYVLSKSGSSLSTLVRWICEIRDWTPRFFVNAIIKYSKVESIREFNADDFKDFQRELENYIIEEILFSEAYREFGYAKLYSKNSSNVNLYRHKLDFSINVFYTIYKSLTNEKKKKFTFKGIRDTFKDILASTLEAKEKNIAFGGLGGFKEDQYFLSWNTIKEIVSCVYILVKRGEVKMNDFTDITLTAARKFCQEKNINPSGPNLDKWRGNFFFYAPNKIFETFLRFSTYLGKVRNLGSGQFLGDFFSAIESAKNEYRASGFSSPSPFGHISFAKKLRFSQKIVYWKKIVEIVGTNHPVVGDLVKFAKDKKSEIIDSFLASIYDNFLHKPSQNPSHEYIGYKSLDQIDDVIAIEVPVWSRFEDRTVISGHIDVVMIKEGIIYVCDYKPNLNISYSAETMNRFSFINSIPQVAAYAIILKKMFGYENIKCVTFNEDAACIFDAKQALEAAIKFYKANSGKTSPTWEILDIQ